MSIIYNNRGVATQSIGRISKGEPGLGTSLLHVEVGFRSFPISHDHGVMELNVTGGVVRVKSKAARGVYMHLGTLTPVHAPTIRQFEGVATSDTICEFTLELSSAQIAAVERVRAGTELAFEIEVHGLASGRGGQGWGSERFTVAATQSDWLRWLAEMNLQETILLEVPIFPNAFQEQFEKAAEFLKQAQQNLLKGHPREVFTCCRQALEAVGHSKGDGIGTTRDLKAMVEKPAKLSKSERVMVLRRGAFVMASLATHAGDDQSLRTDWTLADARCMLTTTAGILQWVAEDCQSQVGK